MTINKDIINLKGCLMWFIYTPFYIEKNLRTERPFDVGFSFVDFNFGTNLYCVNILVVWWYKFLTFNIY